MNEVMRWVILVSAVLLSSLARAEPPFVPNGVLKGVITHKKVSSFFHTKVVKLSTQNLDSKLDVSGLIPKLQLVAVESTEAKSAFQFTKIDWSNPKRVKIWFEYPPEGMKGEVIFSFKNGKAVIQKVQVWET